MFPLFNPDILANLLEFGAIYVLHSSIWIVFVALILKMPALSSPYYHNGLWKLAMIGGICSSLAVTIWGPALYHLPLPQALPDSFFDHQIMVQNRATSESPERNQTLPSDLLQPKKLPNHVKQEALKLPVESDTRDVETEWIYLLVGGWLSISIVLLLKTCMQHKTFMHRISKRKPLDLSHVRNQLSSLKQAYGIRHPVVLSQSADIDSPIAIAGKEICIPSYIVDSFSEQELESILAHEVAHIGRKDHLWMLFTSGLRIVFFFQPLHPYLSRKFQQSAETICDHWTALQIEDPVHLANSLLTIAENLSDRKSVLVPSLAQLTSDLSYRINHLLIHHLMRTNPVSKTRLGLTQLLLATIFFLSLPGFTVLQADINPVIDALSDLGPSESEKHHAPPARVIPEQFAIPVASRTDRYSSLKPISFRSFNLDTNPLPIVVPEFDLPIQAANFQSQPAEQTESSHLSEQPVPPLTNYKVSIDWKNDVNRSHSRYRNYRFWNKKKIRNLYLINQTMNRRYPQKRIGNQTLLVRDAGENSSLIFTLKQGNLVMYDTLINYVDPRGGFLGLSNLYRRTRGKWTSKVSRWRRRAQELGHWRDQGFPSINRRSHNSIGRLPMNTSFSHGGPTDNEIHFGIHPKQAYQEAKVQIRDKQGKIMYILYEGPLSAGEKKYEWKHMGAERTEYLLYIEVDEYFWIRPFSLGRS